MPHGCAGSIRFTRTILKSTCRRRISLKAVDGISIAARFPTDARPLVRKQLMAYQRALALTGSISDCQTLLSEGRDSAMVIARRTESDFIFTSDLPLDSARAVYARSVEQALRGRLSLGAMQDTLWGGFIDLTVNNVPPTLVNDLREIDGFEEYFGSQNYCNCEHCSSNLSPAAYFVDLMYFIEQHVSNPVFVDAREDHPLYLKNRRGDLWKLRFVVRTRGPRYRI